jgi:hypothetical protein
MSLDESAKDAEASADSRLLSVRGLVILTVAAAAALLAAVLGYVVVNRLLAGTGGPLAPASAAILLAGTVFWKSVDMLRRNVR